jgi:hypothetical protein
LLGGLFLHSFLEAQPHCPQVPEGTLNTWNEQEQKKEQLEVLGFWQFF